jgi:hypothetical protein
VSTDTAGGMRVNGWIFFAGIMMVILGTMSGINGLIALFNDDIYLVTKDQIVAFDFTVWGIVHLILGLVVIWAAFSLFSGAVWARVVTAILAGLVIIEQIATIQAYPFWSIAMIGISVAVIFSVSTMGRADEEIELPM